MTRRELLAAALAGPAFAKAKHINRTCLSALTDEIGLTPELAIEFARQYGLRWIELRGVPGAKGGRTEYAFLPEEQVKAAAASFRDAGLKVSFLNSSMLKYAWPGMEPPPRPNEDMARRAKRLEAEARRFAGRMEEVRQAIRNAQILGVDKIRVFTATRVANPESAYPRIADVIGEMAVVAEKEKVQLLVENEASNNIATSQELAAIMKLLPSKAVGLNWDPQNGLGRGEAPFPEGYNSLPKDRIGNVQIKGKGVMDNPQKLDWRAIMQALDRDGYTGRIGLETHIFDGTLIAAAHVSMKEIQRIVDSL